MGGTDASAGEHRNGGLWNHRHVEGHQIAFADAHGLQGVGGFAHLGMELAISETAHVSGLPFPDQRGLLSLGPLEMSIEAVVRQVGGAPFKPAGERRFRPIENRVERLEPMQLTTGCLPPEPIGIRGRRLRHGAVSLQTADACCSCHLRRRLKHPLLLQDTFDRRIGLGHSRRAKDCCCKGKEESIDRSTTRINPSDRG